MLIFENFRAMLIFERPLIIARVRYPDVVYKVATAAILIQTRGVQSVFSLENIFQYSMQNLSQILKEFLLITQIEYNFFYISNCFSKTPYRHDFFAILPNPFRHMHHRTNSDKINRRGQNFTFMSTRLEMLSPTS